MISIGNLAAGGRAKTPLTALIAARLRDAGERPAILSRGYGRRRAEDGVVVVRDPRGIRADLDRAGDEPLMLARQLDGVSVLASSSRYLAGRLAEHHFGATVHLLDDGFQHFELRRNADLVVVSSEDFERPVTLPGGRLREPLDAAVAADAFIALRLAPSALAQGKRSEIGEIAGGRPVFYAERQLSGSFEAEPVLAVAGIASPHRFFEDLRARGWQTAGELSFRDHYRYTRQDVDRVAAAAKSAGARLVVTTEKDFVRLLPFRPFPIEIVAVPMIVQLDDQRSFDEWLFGVIEAARAERASLDSRSERSEPGRRAQRVEGA